MRAGLAAILVSACVALPAVASESGRLLTEAYSERPRKDTQEAAIYRGGIVFHHYCALCHGIKADGNGRTARLYDPKPANLITSDKNNAYKELIIRRGGAAIGRSEYMPPWNDELTDEQVSDVVSYLHSIQAKKP